MITPKNKKISGFTLMETLVTITIFTIIMAGTSFLLRNIYVTSGQQNLSLDTIDRARVATFNFANEIRNASGGNDGSYPLGQASTSQIIFYTAYGAVGTNVNRIRYYIASSTLYKGVITPTGSPLTYTGSEKITSVLPNVLSSSSPIFYYYDGNYAGTSSPLAQPVNLNQVKFVQIKMVINNQDRRNSTSTFIVTTGSTMRNLKTNLGN